MAASEEGAASNMFPAGAPPEVLVLVGGNDLYGLVYEYDSLESDDEEDDSVSIEAAPIALILADTTAGFESRGGGRIVVVWCLRMYRTRKLAAWGLDVQCSFLSGCGREGKQVYNRPNT